MSKRPRGEDSVAQEARDAGEKGPKAAKDVSGGSLACRNRSRTSWPRTRRTTAVRSEETGVDAAARLVPRGGQERPSEAEAVAPESGELMRLYSEALHLLSRCAPSVPKGLRDQVNDLTATKETGPLVVLHSRALDLLSACSRHVSERCRKEIYRLADETGRRTLLPVRVERVNGAVLIDPYGIAG